MKIRLNRIAKDTNFFLENFLNKQDDSKLIPAIKYGLFPGGKKIRSKILIDIGFLLSIDYKTLITIGSAVECIHAYTLIHDDLTCMDDDKIRRGKQSTNIKFGDNIIKVSDAPEALNNFEGKEIVVGIRPEAFEDSVYANEKEFSEQVSIEVSLLEQLGSDTYIHFYKDIKPVQTEAIEEILADDGEDISVLGNETKFIARINPNSTVEEGQKINLALDPTKLHYFDPDSGLAIT